MKTTTLQVRDNHEYGTFFVEESGVVPRKDGKGVQASATWTCYSSFGTFGHHWSSMGSCFSDFIKDVDSHYLLGKISSKHSCARKACDSIREQIKEKLSSGSVTNEQAEAANDAIDDCEAEGSGDVCIHLLYMNEVLNDISIDYDSVEMEEWDKQAVEFVKRLWPKFVEAFRTPALEN
jgi:hypothetical protein